MIAGLRFSELYFSGDGDSVVIPATALSRVLESRLFQAREWEIGLGGETLTSTNALAAVVPFAQGVPAELL
jgi:hypothetical protein